MSNVSLACVIHHALTGCPMSVMVGLSLGIAAAYLLGLGTASAIGIIVWFCGRKRSG